MRTPLNGAALTSLVVMLGLASASCTYPDETQMAADDGVSRPQAAAAGPAASLYPPMQKDAADGHVHEYY